MRVHVPIILAMLLLMSAYSATNAGAQETKQVQIAKNSDDADNGKFYVPKNLTVTVGTTVEWTNLDDAQHTVTDGTLTCVGECWGRIFDSGVMKEGKKFSYTFNESGTFHYLCAFYPFMAGTITVRPQGVTDVKISFTTDKNKYAPGENVSVMGTVSPALPDEKLLIEVLSAGSVLLSESVVSGDGKFSYSASLTDKLAGAGSYTVRVTYIDSSTEQKFVVSEPEKPAKSEKPDKPDKSGKPDKPDKTPPVEEPVEDVTEVRVAAKQAKGNMKLNVRNSPDSPDSIYSLSISTQDATIKSMKGPKAWKTETGDDMTKSMTENKPIPPGGKATFKLKISGKATGIHWTAYSLDGTVLDEGDVKLARR